MNVWIAVMSLAVSEHFKGYLRDQGLCILYI